MKFLKTSVILLLVIASCQEEKDVRKDVPLPSTSAILDLVNLHRYTLGLSSLSPNEICDREAQLHSERMANGNVAFGHAGSETRFEIISSETGAVGLAENVAFGQRSAEEVVQDWLGSEGHRTNIEGDYTHMGLGIAGDQRGQLYFTQIFAKID